MNVLMKLVDEEVEAKAKEIIRNKELQKYIKERAKVLKKKYSEMLESLKEEREKKSQEIKKKLNELYEWYERRVKEIREKYKHDEDKMHDELDEVDEDRMKKEAAIIEDSFFTEIQTRIHKITAILDVLEHIINSDFKDLGEVKYIIYNVNNTGIVDEF